MCVYVVYNDVFVCMYVYASLCMHEQTYLDDHVTALYSYK